MGPIFRFLSSLRNLAQARKISIEDAYKFAKQEFGEVSELLKLQINKIFKDVEAPSIKKPSKPEGKLIEASFKPGKSKYSDKIVEESPSQLMKRLETGIKSLQKENISTGLTRTLAREILMKRGIDLGKGMDPIEIFRSKFGEEILGDVSNLADELIEMEAMGKTPKKLEDILEQEGFFDVKMPKEPPRGYSDEELEAIQKEIDQEDILLKFDPKDREPNATGGRVGLAMGSLPKGIQALVKQINKRFGKGAMKTADEMNRPESAKLKEMFEDFETRNPDPKRQLTDDEIEDLSYEVGDLDAYEFDGTVESANRIRKQYKDYMDDMYQQYRMGKLDPQPGEKGRKEFLEKKMEEMEMSGDRKLMTVDEIEELSTYDLGTQMEEFKNTKSRLQKKYKGMVDDDLLSKMMADDNPQRLAEVEAALDQGLELLKRGKSQEEVLEIITKGTDRTKQAGGGLAYLMGL